MQSGKTAILFIFGTRPEAIKMAPLIKEFKKHDHFRVRVCVTGQHREMLDQVLSFFDIEPDIDLALMRQGQTLSDLSARVLQALDPVLERENPDLVFVQGDTTTVFCGALAAFYRNIKVAHLEAGLRTGNKQSPYPEEMNRILAGHIADYHFAPTNQAVQNLINEGISENVYQVGNTVIDALLMGLSIIRNGSEQKLREKFSSVIDKRRMVLVTGHRRESFGKPFESICRALTRIADKYPDTLILYPVHLNPRVRETVYSFLSDKENIRLIEPVDYHEMIWLESQADIVLTDSGGVQEEAPSLGKPVLVMRDVTERQEGVEAGTAKLVGTDEDTIVRAVETLMDKPEEYEKMANAVNPYGDGTTSRRIVEILSEKLTDE